MQQRLIDANELLKDKVSNAYISRFEIEKAPTIDAEPVVHAHWERHYCFTDMCNKEHIYGYHCSYCGKGWIETQPRRHNYCGWCGAKMDEEQECEI